jgi:hypothetical protein
MVFHGASARTVMAAWSALSCAIGVQVVVGELGQAHVRQRGDLHRDHRQAVAVGLGVDHVLPADGAAGAGLVHDDHALRHVLARGIGEGARERVGAAAGWKGTTSSIGLVGKVARLGVGGGRRAPRRAAGTVPQGGAGGCESNHGVCLRRFDRSGEKEGPEKRSAGGAVK